MLYNLVSNDKKIYDKYLSTAEEVYPCCYTIENSEENNRIVLCCKNENLTGKALLSDYFVKNNDLFKNHTNIYLLNRDYEKIIQRIIYRREKRILG